MCGALLLNGRLAGYIIMLLAAIAASGVPIVHMTGGGLLGTRTVNSSVSFLWIWSNLALGVIALFSLIVAALALWNHLRRKPE